MDREIHCIQKENPPHNINEWPDIHYELLASWLQDGICLKNLCIAST